MKINAIIMSIGITFGLLTSPSAYGSSAAAAPTDEADVPLKGRALIEKVGSDLAQHKGALPALDTSNYPSKGLGASSPVQHEHAEKQWKVIIKGYVPLIQVYEWMRLENPDNNKIQIRYAKVTENDLDKVHWPSINIKMKAFHERHSTLVKNVEEAFLVHLLFVHNGIVGRLPGLTEEFKKNDHGYLKQKKIPLIIAVKDVSEIQDYTKRKDAVIKFLDIVDAREKELAGVQEWQAGYKKIQDGHQALFEDYGLLVAQLASLENVDKSNPFVKKPADFPAFADAFLDKKKVRIYDLDKLKAKLNKLKGLLTPVEANLALANTHFSDKAAAAATDSAAASADSDTDEPAADAEPGTDDGAAESAADDGAVLAEAVSASADGDAAAADE